MPTVSVPYKHGQDAHAAENASRRHYERGQACETKPIWVESQVSSLKSDGRAKQSQLKESLKCQAGGREVQAVTVLCRLPTKCLCRGANRAKRTQFADGTEEG